MKGCSEFLIGLVLVAVAIWVIAAIFKYLVWAAVIGIVLCLAAVFVAFVIDLVQRRKRPVAESV